MGKVLSRLIPKKCMVYQDDTLVMGHTFQEHLDNLKYVLERLIYAGLWLQPKCHLAYQKVAYLGYVISSFGISADTSKVEAVNSFPESETTALISWNGILLSSIYTIFLQNCQSFIILTSNALAYEIGAVLDQQFPDGSEQLTGFVLRTLSRAECNYSQSEREGLACVFGIDKFHSYLLGHSFTLIADHTSLVSRTLIRTSSCFSENTKMGINISHVWIYYCFQID